MKNILIIVGLFMMLQLVEYDVTLFCTVFTIVSLVVIQAREVQKLLNE